MVGKQKHDYQLIINTYLKLGSKIGTAKELGISRSVVRYALRKHSVKDIKGGKISYAQPKEMPLPEKGKIKTYLLTSAQNNTDINKAFWKNLLAYSEYLDAEIMVSRFTYDKASYQSSRAVKPGKGLKIEDKQEAWWAPELSEYVCDDPEKTESCRYELAPGLMFCAEMNILPTAVRPLSGLETYTRTDSGIFPHAKIAMESIATASDRPAKFIYTTGAITKRNYIQKKAGLKAEFHHAYGALIVEVNADGDWWARQLNADSSGAFCDIPSKAKSPAIMVKSGTVKPLAAIEAINWGDVHLSEIENKIKIANWGQNGIIDQLKPKRQFMHDTLSFRSRSHHERKQFGKLYKKFLEGTDSVEEEVKVTAEALKDATRKFCETIVVDSNHDRHGERWLDEADFKKDLLNAEFYLEAQLARVRAYKDDVPWNFNEWSLKRAGVSSTVNFLQPDESYVICKDSGGIECSLHGDLGPNGARGSTQSLTKLGMRVNKGHDHQATIKDGVYSAGACKIKFDFMSGPSSHSISHILTYPTGKRAIITHTDRGFRATPV